MSISGFVGQLASLFRPHWRKGLVILGGLLLEMALAAAVPFSFKFIIDSGLIGGNRRALIYMLVALGAGAVIVSVTGLLRDYLYAGVAAAVLGRIRLSMFEHLQRLSQAYYARTATGDILARFSSDLAVVEHAVASAIPWGILPALDVIACTVLLFLIDWRLALVAMLVWPLCLIGPRIFAPRAVLASYRRKEDEAKALAVIQENVLAQSVVKAFSLEQRSVDAFAGANHRVGVSTIRFGFLSALVERSAGIGILLLQVGVLAAGAWMAATGRLTIGSLAAFQALFLSLSSSLSYVSQYVPTLVQGAGGMERIQHLLRERVQVADAPESATLPRLARAIEFRDVHFSYGGDRPSLAGVHLHIEQGRHVALVGASGSGKSSTLNLLLRFYDPESGAVSIDGRDLRQVTLDSLRAQIGIVFQESFLFNTSLRENIRLGRPDANDADVEAAARAAEIHDFIVALPKGYETVVGERGGLLSGGQRQRVAIARAILRDPPILVLDEATSALDPSTEAALQETVKRLGVGRTMVTVTHRLASVAETDRIFVFDAGRVIEQGRHEELIARNGHYKMLWNKQRGFTVNDDGDLAGVSAARLREMEVLAPLGDALLASVARLFYSERHPAGRTIVHEGDPGDHFYVIVRGTVRVSRVMDGDDRTLAVLQDGDYFGEMALLRDVPRTASVSTLTPTLLLSLERAHFSALLEQSPALRALLERTYAARVARRASVV